MPVTRGVGFSPEIVEEVCERIARGETLDEIFDDTSRADLPTLRTFMNWMNRASREDASPELREALGAYELALEVRMYRWAEETIRIADDGRNDYVERTNKDGQPYIAFDREAVMRSKLRVETRHWHLERLRPKRYGALVRQEHTGADGAPLIPNVTVGPSKAALGAAIAVMLGGADNAGHNDNPAPRSSDSGA